MVSVVSEAPLHPGPASTGLPASIVRQLVDHARREDPNEACGLILGSAPAADGGRALRFEPTLNASASPYRYEIDSKDLLRLTIESDDRDEVFWAIVHSHTHSPARPSPTDVGLAFYPDALYILVSLADLEPDTVVPDPAAVVPGSPGPHVRAWRIVDRQVFEVALAVTE